ncbi:hypothetical protein RDWZM_010068 [Blomia tropicalis]|uniref:Uncharacterized protein n=1 Tax=Blomia tropicalis TaxID=40697 RepID=A0A9Q0LW32_BLOTA|nr:hypothetical protein RDWZM_010068 [Blomia tropicalis]
MTITTNTADSRYRPKMSIDNCKSHTTTIMCNMTNRHRTRRRKRRPPNGYQTCTYKLSALILYATIILFSNVFHVQHAECHRLTANQSQHYHTKHFHHLIESIIVNNVPSSIDRRSRSLPSHSIVELDERDEDDDSFNELDGEKRSPPPTATLSNVATTTASSTSSSSSNNSQLNETISNEELNVHQSKMPLLQQSTNRTSIDMNETIHPSFDFTKSFYNVSIPENAFYKYATPMEKMGIYITDPELNVRYKIVAGDQQKIFKAEAKHIGDFFFLLIRMRHGTSVVLNREYLSSYELRVRATITSKRNDGLRLKAKCTVMVTVEDRNDISPIFVSDSYDVQVNEDVPLDTAILNVTAYDPDIGRNGDIYYSLIESTNLFAIHPTNGIIYTTRPLSLSTIVSDDNHNSQTLESYQLQLTVMAKDRGYHRGTSTVIESSKAKVNIRIMAVNRYQPKITIKQHRTIAYTASGRNHHHHRPIYAIINVNDADHGQYGQICSFDIVSGNDGGWFALTNSSSPRDFNLELIRSFNDNDNDGSLHLMIKATDCGGRWSNETIIISTESTLENDFTFTSGDYYREIHENSLPGTLIIQLSLKSIQSAGIELDDDIEHYSQMITNGKFQFTIIDGNDEHKFGISRNGILYTTERLDREDRSKYTLVIRVQHELNRIATTMIHIEILDDNDNYPIFEHGNQMIVNVSIPENRPNGSVVYRAVATDADIGNNGYISYELIYYGHETNLPFMIDPYTGTITTNRPLDYESMSRYYHLFVRASDWGEPFRRQTEMMLNITIEDVNDHRPQFEAINCTAYLSVNTKPYSKIMTFNAFDDDHNSIIRYRMFTPEAEQCFRLDETTGQLELICNLKKEMTRNKLIIDHNHVLWTLSITATDGNYFSDPNYLKIIISNDDSMIGKRNARIECTDSILYRRNQHYQSNHNNNNNEWKNDQLTSQELDALESIKFDMKKLNNIPIIDRTLNEISIPENTPIHRKIATLFANDSDHGYDGTLIWSLNLQQYEHDDDNYNRRIYFDINQTTGELMLISQLDYEHESMLTLFATVCDQSIENRLCSNQTIKILVEDVNDNPPLMDNFVFNISESAPIHSFVGTLFATDDDSGDNSALEYFLDGHVEQFTIDLFNGTIRLEQTLDHETISKYTLYATVTDSGTPSLSSTSMITIYVDDVNDNQPEFYQKAYFIKVREDIPIGSRLTRITAFDRDDGRSAMISYSLVDSNNPHNQKLTTNSLNMFEIDELTGNIRLRESLDYERNQMYNLTIIAIDHGKPPLSNSVILLIEVEDVDENYHAPKFSDFYAVGSVKENEPIGTVVTTVIATDPDDSNQTLNYQIVGGSGLGRFTIDSNGVVYSNVVFDCENGPHYWLTVVAKDRAAVPLSARLELYISIEDVDDMPPITTESFYHKTIMENVTIGSKILQLKAYDQDYSMMKRDEATNNEDIQFRIGNNNVPFEIDSNGWITTTNELDHETNKRFVLDIEIMDKTSINQLSTNVQRRSLQSVTNSGYVTRSRTPVIIDIIDVNEYEPKSILHTYRCRTYNNVDQHRPLCHIVANDRDHDDSCPITFQLIDIDNEENYFRLDNNTGIFYSNVERLPKGSHDFTVKITDCDQMSSTVFVIIRVLVPRIEMINDESTNNSKNSRPMFEPIDPIIVINRDESIGQQIAFVKTIDDTGDHLCTYIIDGNVDHTFAYLPTGSLVLARSLMNRFQTNYNLTLLVTDGLNNSTLNLMINVRNDIDQVMEFAQQHYTVNVLENITIGTDILQLTLMEPEPESASVIYSIYSTNSPDSLTKFEIDSRVGKIRVKNSIDYEANKQHVLIIESRNNRKHTTTSFNNRAFTKVTINVIDVNDQKPQFIMPYFESTILESSSIGTSIVQVQAFDSDFGTNAEINYTLIAGTVESTMFDIEPKLGYIYLTGKLNHNEQPEYYLSVRATDNGLPPLSNTANVHIIVTVPDNTPPKFEQDNYFVDIREDEKIGTVILSLRMLNKQSTYFMIIDGNVDDSFAINVNNGELYLRKHLDYERITNYSLTIGAENMFATKTSAKIFITIIDVNDNAPFWNRSTFTGLVYETLPIDSIVMNDDDGQPLIVNAYDRDSLHNSILLYSIVDEHAKKYFQIEPRTGAISLIGKIGYEQFDSIEFQVSVSDYGYPPLKASSNALVRIKCLPVNDCPPIFKLNTYYSTLMLPTFMNVIVTKVSATDCDLRSSNLDGKQSTNYLQYSLYHHNRTIMNQFRINGTTGQILTATDQFEVGPLELIVTVFDGKFSNNATVVINVKMLPHSSLRFKDERYYGSIMENSSMIKTIVLPSIEGNRLHEHLVFRIMNPTDHFMISRTSGAILYRGTNLIDRESINKFELAIEVQSISLKHRIAHALVEIVVDDINDNRPIFVGLPYHFVFNQESTIGTVINRVQAVDMDIGDNGLINYSIISGDENGLFALNTKTGQLSLQRNLDETNDPLNYTLVIMAKDCGEPPLHSMTNVTLRMVTGGVPIFVQSYYNVSVSEAHAPMVPFVTIKAESTNGRQLFYLIEQGNDNDEFALDFSTGMVSIAERLDREAISRYNLLISATDAISGASSTVNLYINVEDTNDNPPMFSKSMYNISVAENRPIGSSITRLMATDSDIGVNGKLQYRMIGNVSHHFYITPDDGIIYLKSPLDHETESRHHFSVMVTDYGTPQLTSTAQVWIEVIDVNDNVPTLPPSFNTTINEDMSNGDFVTRIIANDRDWIDRDRLRYRIQSGNDMTFMMNETTGIISVRHIRSTSMFMVRPPLNRYFPSRSYQQQRFYHYHEMRRTYSLNISVSDGIYSSTEVYHIHIKPSNHYSPKFARSMNNLAISELTTATDIQKQSSTIFTINATDLDENEMYGTIEYSIMNDGGRKKFAIDSHTGQIWLRERLDYELDERFYWLIIGASDRGHRLGVAALRIAITDQNDNIPQFIVDEYRSTICSNVPIGQTILAVLAFDSDEDVINQRNRIHYSIYDAENSTKILMNDDENDTNTNSISTISDYFDISPETGHIKTIKNITDLAGKMVQFFVKVSDLNVLPSSINSNKERIMNSIIPNVVPVTIQIGASSCVHQSSIPKKRKDSSSSFLYEVFVKENVERGSIVVNLNLDAYKDVDLSIVSTSNDDENEKKNKKNRMAESSSFRIDRMGRIHWNEPFDREMKAKHVLVIQVKDKITFTTEYLYVIINIMDANDCTPYFDSSSYYVSLSEDQEIGSSIFKINSLDDDVDILNSALRYQLNDTFNQTFSIDENSGWIILNRQLDRETIRNYDLLINVTDGLHSNSTILHVDVLDVNDNPPMMNKTNMIASIEENSILGTVVLSVDAYDLDQNTDLKYYIIDGDQMNQFAIASNGDLYVNKPLDRELIQHYELIILVSDGRFQTETIINIDIMDINDNGPICVKSNYIEMVSESVRPGTYILTIDAIDDDDGVNRRLFYTLDGEHYNHFKIDSETGRLSTLVPLDREKREQYHFHAVVYDAKNRHWSCTSYIEIRLSDVNDEPPKFINQMINSVQIAEDSPIGIMLGKVTAIDRDHGHNRHVRYELMNNREDFFIDEHTGIIRLSRSLDRETRSSYNLTIIAVDSGSTQLNSSTNFMIIVTDINDNAPEFEMQSYTGMVDEDATIGTMILKIFATSKDTGVNAEIRYSIQSGNDNDTFIIDETLGTITVGKMLDYELKKEYYLIVKAEDGGSPPLSNEVNVRLIVNDINDNRPTFVQRSYDIVIREDSLIGDRILQLIAIDHDSPPNANLTYSFIGNLLSYKEFDIDPLLGILTIGRPLDREMMSAYILEVFCNDNGQPAPLQASVFVNIEISDYNDNAPTFDRLNQTIHVQEGRPIGYTLTNFVITDADSATNSGPFKFSIVSNGEEEEDDNDNQKWFTVVDEDASLRTNIVFNHTERSEYKVAVRVNDSGTPSLSSINWITVIVIQEPQIAPKLQPLTISVNSLEQFPGGIIGQVNASDDDRYDKLTYSLTNVNDRNIFSIDQNDGTLVAFPGLDAGKYKLNVTVNDGKFISYGMVEIEVQSITESMIENALVIKLRSISVKEFVSNHMRNFVRTIKNLFNVRGKDVTILSIQPAERKSLRRHHHNHHNIHNQQQQQQHRRRRRRRLERRQSIEAQPPAQSSSSTFGDISIMFVVANSHGGYFTRNWLKNKLNENKYRIENQLDLRFDEIHLNSECEHIQCTNGECREDLILTENEITSIVGVRTSFVSPFHEYRFGCACNPGFGGQTCNVTVNECARNPCPSYKECVPVSSTLGYLCQCPFGKSGTNCNQNAETCHSNERDVSFCYQEFNPISFNGDSFVKYDFVKRIDKISLRFRTQQLKTTIFKQQIQDSNAFSILEITNGYIQYRFNCTEGEGLVRIHHQTINDGRWHEIIVERKGNAATLILDRKNRGNGLAPSASAMPGLSGSACSRHSRGEIYFGGEIRDESMVRSGFVGCLDNILFNGQQIPFHTTTGLTKSSIVTLRTLANIEFDCNFKPDNGPCRLQPCMNGGSCINLSNGSYACLCNQSTNTNSNTISRYGGRNCEIDRFPCQSSPCMNGGICSIIDTQKCSAGLPNCYECKCLPTYTGPNCQMARFCTMDLCNNGGMCEETPLGPKCRCHSGWHGLYCQHDVDECQLGTPACHQSATCINLPGTYRCICALNSTTPCNGENLLPSNIVSAKMFSYDDILVLSIGILVVIISSILIVCVLNCRNRSAKKRTPKISKESNEMLLKNASNGIYDDFSGNYGTRTSKTSHLEMANMQCNNIILGQQSQSSSQQQQQTSLNGQQSQRPTSYVDIFNGHGQQQQQNFADYDLSPPSNDQSISGIGSNMIHGTNTTTVNNFNKRIPLIASVSPQLIENKQSPKNSKMPINNNNNNKSKIQHNDRAKQLVANARVVSLNDSSDSNVVTNIHDEPHSSINSVEGYHWDNLDLYANEVDDDMIQSGDDNRSATSRLLTRSNLQEFSGDYANMINREELEERCRTRRICRNTKATATETSPNTQTLIKSTNDDDDEEDELEIGSEHSPLLCASGSAQTIEQDSIDHVCVNNSPLARVDLSGNMLEYYLPKHDIEDEDEENGPIIWKPNVTTNGNHEYKRKNILHYENGSNVPAILNGSATTTRGTTVKPNRLTFSRSNLNGHQQQQHTTSTTTATPSTTNQDNYSLHTPSSSSSITNGNEAPVPMMMVNSSSSNEMCCSSLSSGSNPSDGSKVSPIANQYTNQSQQQQHLYANMGPNCLTSFGYSTVNLGTRLPPEHDSNEQTIGANIETIVHSNLSKNGTKCSTPTTTTTATTSTVTNGNQVINNDKHQTNTTSTKHGIQSTFV